MTTSGEQLLRRLQGSALPTTGRTTAAAAERVLAPRGGSGDHAPAAGSASVAGISFADLIQRAERGQVGVVRPVRVPRDVVLDEVQREQLPLIVDRFEAVGSQRGLVVWPDVCCTVDVADRSVSGTFSRAESADGGEDRLISDIQAVMFVQSAGGSNVPSAADSSGASDLASLVPLARLGAEGRAAMLLAIAEGGMSTGALDGAGPKGAASSGRS